MKALTFLIDSAAYGLCVFAFLAARTGGYDKAQTLLLMALLFHAISTRFRLREKTP